VDLLERFAVDYDTGTVLFREGELGQEMYVVQAGEVEISRQIGDRRQVLATLGAGEFFGEMAIVNNRPRSATATIVQPARLLVVDAVTFEAMLRARTEIAVRLIRALANRLERANQQVELLLLRDANHRVVQCLRRLAEEFGDDVASTGGGGVYLPVSHHEIALRAALPPDEVLDILGRLAQARLVVHASEANLVGEGYLLPEVGRLLEFLEFLELKDRA
jgi:CRP/FNR family transcriptional regulator, cyclic AMP receptor protein